MARLLIRATDNGTWKARDIVYALPDGSEWGKLETLAGGFYQVDLPGLSVAEGLAKSVGSPVLDAEGKDIAPRRYQVDLDAIERRTGDRSVYVTGKIARPWDDVKTVALSDKAAK